jgi:hypothetical protein
MRFDHWIIGGLVVAASVFVGYLAQQLPQAAEAVAAFAR